MMNIKNQFYLSMKIIFKVIENGIRQHHPGIQIKN